MIFRLLLSLFILIIPSIAFPVCYSLDGCIYHPDETILNDITVALPKLNDVKIVTNLHEGGKTIFTGTAEISPVSNVYQRCFMIRYKTKADRDAKFDQIKSVVILGTKLSGSWVQKHTCYHDGNPPLPCVVEDRYEIP